MTPARRVPGKIVSVVLAAGKGTRMNSARPKVLFEVLGRPIVQRVVDAAREAGCSDIVVVVGYEADRVKKSLEGVSFALQPGMQGTGQALQAAAESLDSKATRTELSKQLQLQRKDGSLLWWAQCWGCRKWLHLGPCAGINKTEHAETAGEAGEGGAAAERGARPCPAEAAGKAEDARRAVEDVDACIELLLEGESDLVCTVRNAQRKDMCHLSPGSSQISSTWL